MIKKNNNNQLNLFDKFGEPENIKDEQWFMPQDNIKWQTPFIQQFLWRMDMKQENLSTSVQVFVYVHIDLN